VTLPILRKCSSQGSVQRTQVGDHTADGMQVDREIKNVQTICLFEFFGFSRSYLLFSRYLGVSLWTFLVSRLRADYLGKSALTIPVLRSSNFYSRCALLKPRNKQERFTSSLHNCSLATEMIPIIPFSKFLSVLTVVCLIQQFRCFRRSSLFANAR
jgi:hypothetical protein